MYYTTIICDNIGVPINTVYDNHMCVILFILQYTYGSNIVHFLCQ